jgi:hypothetical protein
MPGGLPLWEATSKDRLHRERQRERANTGPKIGAARRARSTCSTPIATLFDSVEDFQLSADFRHERLPYLTFRNRQNRILVDR